MDACNNHVITVYLSLLFVLPTENQFVSGWHTSSVKQPHIQSFSSKWTHSNFDYLFSGRSIRTLVRTNLSQILFGFKWLLELTQSELTGLTLECWAALEITLYSLKVKGNGDFNEFLFFFLS